jgi:hypothetical protein
MNIVFPVLETTSIIPFNVAVQLDKTMPTNSE